MIVFDSHCDSSSQMYRLRDFGKDNLSPAQVDFPKMLRGGIGASFFALYLPPRLSTSEAASYADALIDVVEKQVAANSSMAAIAFDAASVRTAADEGKVAVMLGMENGSALGSGEAALAHFYKRGVRYVTLTHSRDNQLCDSCSGSGTWGGLSPEGREMVQRMNALGMLIDLAHSSDETVSQVLDISEKPVAFTHGCCRALTEHRRNLPDNLIKKLADKGGVMGISIYPCFVSSEFNRVLETSHLEDRLYLEDEFIADPSNIAKREAWFSLQREYLSLKRPGVSEVADHIDHAVKVGGIEAVGIGTDYDGIEVACAGLEDISHLRTLLDELSHRGYSDDQIEKIAGLNLLRIL